MRIWYDEEEKYGQAFKRIDFSDMKRISKKYIKLHPRITIDFNSILSMLDDIEYIQDIIKCCYNNIEIEKDSVLKYFCGTSLFPDYISFINTFIEKVIKKDIKNYENVEKKIILHKGYWGVGNFSRLLTEETKESFYKSKEYVTGKTVKIASIGQCILSNVSYHGDMEHYFINMKGDQ